MKYRTEDLREWGDLIRSCVVKKKDEFGQVHLIQDINCQFLKVEIIDWAIIAISHVEDRIHFPFCKRSSNILFFQMKSTDEFWRYREAVTGYTR